VRYNELYGPRQGPAIFLCGSDRHPFWAYEAGAIHGIVSDAASVAERYHWEDGLRWNIDHQSVAQWALVRLSNVQRVNIPLASTATETRVKDLRQTSNEKPGLEIRLSTRV
jgi:hypothetical protein